MTTTMFAEALRQGLVLQKNPANNPIKLNARRRMIRRLFPGRDPPVLTRLLQEIVEANEKFNASK